MEGAVFQVKGNNTHALALVHDQIQRKVLDEEVCVVSQRLAVQAVEDSVPCAIGGGCTSVCLPALAEFQRLATESTLIDLALLRTREWDTEPLQLDVYGQIRRYT